MDVMNHQQAEREAQRVQANREELVERIARALRADGTAQPLQGLHLYRHSFPLEQVYSVVEPSLCVVAQGSKEFLLGESRYRYDPFHYLLVTVDLPYVGQVLEASKERPFLSLRLDLAPTLVGEVMVEAGHTSPRDPAEVRAIAVSPVDGHLLDAMVRVARLLDAPDEARVLMPLITREMIYRLLRGEQGARLRHLAILGGYSPSIARAIERLRQDFDQPLRIEQLARELGMSVSVFHHQFKAVTALSPLQFQKRLRLLEARRLMMGEDLDAASAAYRVGYHDASHFNREYKSHVAHSTQARCATAAGRGLGKCWPMSKTRTARQVDERWLHESSFSLPFCLRFALREMVPTGALLTEHMRSRPEVAWRQFPERLEAFLTRHTRLLHKLSRFITTNVAWLR